MTLSSLHVGLQKMESSYAGGVELGEETEVSVKSVEQLEFIDLIWKWQDICWLRSWLVLVVSVWLWIACAHVNKPRDLVAISYSSYSLRIEESISIMD